MELKTEWVKCPVCGNKTRNKVREDTVLKQFPLFCPKCKKETLVDISKFMITIVKEPDAKTQS
ncbi:MAG: cysteine-rich KTR domain-containing protein [Lachnospiraceae bacterium]|nr:cysteine-rich KTR domain-containing protein [Lachnospiraceae bacterium]